jgi:hypothetical protein
LLPEDKVSIIEEAVIIVGDGINDAPALTNYSFYEGAIFLDPKFKTIKIIPVIISKDISIAIKRTYRKYNKAGR